MLLRRFDLEGSGKPPVKSSPAAVTAVVAVAAVATAAAAAAELMMLTTGCTSWPRLLAGGHGQRQRAPEGHEGTNNSSLFQSLHLHLALRASDRSIDYRSLRTVTEYVRTNKDILTIV